MHRTTTTATLLVTVALSAVSGCTTVQQGPTAVPPTSAPSPEGDSEPQIVQAPAREALEMIGPSRRPDPATPEPRRPTAQVPSPARHAPSPRTHSRPPSDPPRPEPRRPRRPPPADVPDVTAPVREDTDVCALGSKYGGWRPDSPEAVICEQTYGR
ncbi:hypothetical protein [Streptomyces chromofuscus]|uniref:Lipoprotein n=1 Tax=Streptomyces chromofuscus TaxID=42881 RepID=A0A7M2TDS1_STRCW|nr:hypothetical protein [Streptomyces chromofuscus]QOV45451.1 hypothetical protein IPT68_05760 [Streptomyces chromofuscus]GGS97425.1 lipoprotein [Streptomyces chromofuscus]